MSNNQLQNNKTRYRFRFTNVFADPDLERKANLQLVQLLALAPPAATAEGFVERNENFYVCAIEIASPYRNFIERAGGLTPHSAVQRALEKLEDRLYRWRFGGGNNENSLESPLRNNQLQIQG